RGEVADKAEVGVRAQQIEDREAQEGLASVEREQDAGEHRREQPDGGERETPRRGVAPTGSGEGAQSDDDEDERAERNPEPAEAGPRVASRGQTGDQRRHAGEV